MMTLRQLSAEHDTIPTTTSWYLAELGEARGKQDMFIKQSPQKLKVLREHALIESAVSSNRIEGVEVEKSRINTLIFGKPLLRDRNEEEVRGYREALKRIHGQGANLTISEKIILELHRLCRGEIWDAGKYKEKNGDIIKSAYKEFEERLGRVAEPRGAKTELILEAISKMDGAFSIGHIQARCPFVSVEMIRKVLKKERNLGKIECLSRGRDAKWMQVKRKK